MPDLELERDLRSEGILQVVGIDEAGRGPLAGPVSAAAVVLPHDYGHEWLDDSKKLSEKKREILYQELTQDSKVLWAHSFVSVQEIDQYNILKATHLAMARAVDGLKGGDALFCLIDGLDVPDFPYPSRGIVKGDTLSLSIAAASIIAKVKRDRYMLDLDTKYPQYGFAKHKGYGTKKHLEALSLHGISPEHRTSFRPVKERLIQE